MFVAEKVLLLLVISLTAEGDSRSAMDQAMAAADCTHHVLNNWWPSLWHLYVSPGANESNINYSTYSMFQTILGQKIMQVPSIIA